MRCASDTSGEVPVREMGQQPERQGEHQIAMQVGPCLQARGQAGREVSGSALDCIALLGVLSKADKES